MSGGLTEAQINWLENDFFGQMIGKKCQLFANTTASRKDDVITASIWAPHLSDEEMARRLLCAVSTVRKWRAIAHLYGFSFATQSGRVRMRLKRPVYGG